jgi:coenzyme PQQ synthesis protein D (PqqD)
LGGALLVGFAGSKASGSIMPVKRVLHYFEDNEGNVTLGPRAQPVATLNETAAHIWHLCDGNRCLDNIADAMADEFNADRKLILKDIRETILMLASNRLISF